MRTQTNVKAGGGLKWLWNFFSLTKSVPFGRTVPRY